MKYRIYYLNEKNMQLGKIKIPKKYQTLPDIIAYLNKNYDIFNMIFVLDENKNIVTVFEYDRGKYIPMTAFKR